MTGSDTRLGGVDVLIPAEFDPPPFDVREAIAAGRIAMSCDEPGNDAGGPMALPIHISGWAYSRAGVNAVAVTVDGEPTRCSYGLLRHDISEALAEEQAANSGFSLVLDAVNCPPGPHRLCVIAVGASGAAIGVVMDILAEQPLAEALPPVVTGEPPEPPEQRLDNGGERYVPELHRGGLIEVEHETRYTWAAGLTDGLEVLDAGCGVGWGTGRLLAGGARRAVGVDLDARAIANAAERTPGAEFVRGDLLELPFPDAAFDLVVCFEAIEHVTDTDRALDELRRVLRPGGWLVISSPNRGVYPAGNPFHLSELTSAELEASLGARFGHVALYRQRDHVTSLLVGDEGFAADDPATPVDVTVRKLRGSRPGEETYTVAIAGDEPPPELRGIAFLAEPLDIVPFMEQMGLLEHRALLAEAERSAAHGEVNTVRFQRDRAHVALQETELRRARLAEELERERASRASAERVLTAQRASLSWRLTAPLRLAKRAAAARR